MRLGLNVAATSTLAYYGGSNFVRMPLWIGQEQITIDRYQAILAKGSIPLLVLDRRSFTEWGWNRQAPSGSMKMWHSLFPTAPLIEACNEPDGTGDSSSSQSKIHFTSFLQAARETWPDAFLISGGLVAIDFSYLDAIRLSKIAVNAVGFHPYAQDADSVKPLIAEIRKHLAPGTSLWATELGQQYVEGEEHDRAVWLSNLLVSLWEEGVEAAAVYCGKMDQGEHGLIAQDGTELEAWAAFVGAIPALSGPAPTPAPDPAPTAEVVWIGSPNYNSRQGSRPTTIVLHTMSGTLAGCDSWFMQSASQVSAHYGVGLDGRIHQYVNEGDAAWANGILEPGNTWPHGSANPNRLTISIETEDKGSAATPVSDQQYNSVLSLVQAIMARNPQVTELATHHVISPSSRAHCPGDRWIASGRFNSLASAAGLKALV